MDYLLSREKIQSETRRTLTVFFEGSGIKLLSSTFFK